MSESARRRAEESVSARFSRVMNASTSRLGVLTDPSIVGAVTAPIVVGLLAALRVEAAPAIVLGLEIVAAVPAITGLACALALRGARGEVVDWLAGLPFPLENMNAVLNGLGDTIEVSFRGAAPDVPALNVDLDKVSVESFVMKAGPEGRDPAAGEPRWVEIRVGVVDSKRNPSRTNHRRFERVRAIVDGVLVPLAERYPIAEARIR